MDLYSWVRRSLSGPPKTTHTQHKNKETQKDEEELFGITDQLIDLINSFTLDTFKNFPLQDDEGANCGGDGNVRKDLSDWQERHAILVLAKVKELSQLRFRLCPSYLKERQFWRIYFTLVKSYLAEYELRSIRLEKLEQMKMENENVSDTSACEVEMSQSDTSACEVEMSQAKQATSVDPATSLEQNLYSLV